MYVYVTCGICISSSDCDSFSMSSMERAVKVSDWSLQAILSIDSMAMLPTMVSSTYTQTYSHAFINILVDAHHTFIYILYIQPDLGVCGVN